jgi:hypothetical protein
MSVGHFIALLAQIDRPVCLDDLHQDTGGELAA